MEVLRGTLKNIRFNGDGGYLIGEITKAGGGEEVRVIGTLPNAAVGASYAFTGEYQNHEMYGRQFRFRDAQEVVPTTEEGLRKFLGSGIIDGIGPKLAAQIVDAFGEETLSVLDSEPDRLLALPGIGPKILEKIRKSYAEHRSFMRTAEFLSECGIGNADAARIYETYGEDAEKIVRSDPYRMVRDVKGIGFRKADQIAQKIDVPEDSPFRIRSALMYLLMAAAEHGDTYIPEEELVETAAQMLELTRVQIRDEKIRMLAGIEPGADPSEPCGEAMLVEKTACGAPADYLPLYYRAECRTARRIVEIASARPKKLDADVDYCIRVSEEESGIALSEEQKDAVKESLNHGISVITGGPGTGKTTVIGALLSIFENAGFAVRLAAPTGRAAKRMTEATGRGASTIHRLLEYSYDDEMGNMVFGKNQEDPLKADVLIVDEASMIDLLLMDALTAAILPGTRLILTGDRYQLPSVGAGDVLHDLIDCGLSDQIRVSHLTKIFRQGEESMIIRNAEHIHRGEEIEEGGRSGAADFYFVKRGNDVAVQQEIVSLTGGRIAGFVGIPGFEPLRDIQVITPTRKGEAGTEALNAVLQQKLNPPGANKAEKRFGGTLFREGDKVMQTRNDYELTWSRPGESEEHHGVYNGDLGFIRAIDGDAGQITVVYDDDRYAVYSGEKLEDLSLAYAVTVHKSQGSEFPVVIFALGPCVAYPLRTRNLLYTGVTRGRKLDVLVGSPVIVNTMIWNDQSGMRRTSLRERMEELSGYFGEEEDPDVPF